jgi:hypothetical protein
MQKCALWKEWEGEGGGLPWEQERLCKSVSPSCATSHKQSTIATAAKTYLANRTGQAPNRSRESERKQTRQCSEQRGVLARHSALADAAFLRHWQTLNKSGSCQADRPPPGNHLNTKSRSSTLARVKTVKHASPYLSSIKIECRGLALVCACGRHTTNIILPGSFEMLLYKPNENPTGRLGAQAATVMLRNFEKHRVPPNRRTYTSVIVVHLPPRSASATSLMSIKDWI